MRVIALSVMLVSALFPGVQSAADEADFARALADHKADYEQRLSALEAEVASLRQGRGPTMGATSWEPEAGPPKLQLRGFGHVQYDTARERPRGGGARESTNHFTVGAIDLFISSQIAEDVSFFTETEWDFSAEGKGKLDVERVILKFDVVPWFNISGGRGHTALGYWNQTFHHGTWLQTTTERPLIYAFNSDGGILPIHFVGLEFAGNIDTKLGLVSYLANVANGRSEVLGEEQMKVDGNDSKMLSLMVTLEPKEDLGIGFSVLSDRIPGDPALDPSRAKRIDELIFGAHTYYQAYPYDFIAEILAVQHDDHTSSQDFNHYGGYVQLGYALGLWKPYYRFDFLNIKSGDPYFTDFTAAPLQPIRGAETTVQHTVGLRWDLRTYMALKAEYRYLRGSTLRDGATTVQASFAF